MRIERSGDSRRTANGNPRAAGIYPPSPAQTAERIKPLHQLGRVGEVPSAPVRRMPLTMVVAGMIGAVAIVGGGVVIVLASARQDVPAPDPSPSGSLGVTRCGLTQIRTRRCLKRRRRLKARKRRCSR